MNRFFIIYLFLFPYLSNAQAEEQTQLAKFTITDAKNDGVDITPTIMEAGAYTVFYTIANDDYIYMANVWPNMDSQSFGPMYAVEFEELEESKDNFEADFFTFNWSYTNSYDGITGTATVHVTKVYKPQGVAFTIKIIPEDLEVIVYKGYMDGTIDFSVYD